MSKIMLSIVAAVVLALAALSGGAASAQSFDDGACCGGPSTHPIATYYSYGPNGEVYVWDWYGGNTWVGVCYGCY